MAGWENWAPYLTNPPAGIPQRYIPSTYREPPPHERGQDAPLDFPVPGVCEMLEDLAADHERIVRQTVKRPEEKGPPPWVQMPPDAQPFDYFGTIALPAAPSAETVALSFEVPTGWDGVIFGLGNTYTGAGFGEGSGEIIWRLRRDLAYVRNYDNILNTFGDMQNPREVQGGILIFAKERIDYTVEHVSNGMLSGRTICQLNGYFWPRQ